MARLALERKSSELLVQKRHFGRKFVAKKQSAYKGSFDPKKTVLTTGWAPPQHPQTLQLLQRLDPEAFVDLCLLCVPIPFPSHHGSLRFQVHKTRPNLR